LSDANAAVNMRVVDQFPIAAFSAFRRSDRRQQRSQHRTASTKPTTPSSVIASQAETP